MRKTKLFLSLLMATILSVGNVWATDYEELFTITSAAVVNNTSAYAKYEQTIDGRGWIITYGGNKSSVGTNKNNRGNCTLTNYSKYAVSPVTTSSTASAFASTTVINNVSKISYKHNEGSNDTNTKVYLLYSANGTTFSQLSLTSGTQGATIADTEFTFAECSGYFALLFEATNSSGNWRIDAVEIKFYTAATAKPSVSIDPAITGGELSITGAEDLSAVDPETELTVTATPGEGYKLPATIIFKDADGNTIANPEDELFYIESDSKNGGEFLMPDYDITVSATFTAKALSAVTVTNPAHGAITVKDGEEEIGATVQEGKVLTVSVSGFGYTFTPKAYKTGDENTEVAISEGTLTMPDYAITITADETEITTPTITLSEEILNFGEVAKGAAVPAAKTFTIDGVHLTGDLALAWDAEGDEAFTYEITAGSLTATDGAVSATVAVTPKSTATAGNFANTLTVSGGGATAQEVLVGFDVLETYTATWSVNGVEVKTQTDVAGAELSFPANPVASGDCADLFFQGWTEAALTSAQDEAPTYTSKTEMPEADVNFYAVFATKTVEEVEGDPEWVEVKAVPEAGTYAICSDSYFMKAEISSSRFANGSATPSISNGKLTVAPASDCQWEFSINASGKYLIKNGSNYAAGTGSNNQGKLETDATKTSAQWTITYDEGFVISNDGQAASSKNAILRNNNTYGWGTYAASTGLAPRLFKLTETKQTTTTYSDFLTTCPHCNTVTLAKAAAENGEFTLKVGGVEVSSVKTCEGATVDVEFEPATGYTLDAFTVSGVEGATYADGKITIPEGAEGTLTATATFAAINYTVTMAQTGGAEATLSADQENKHFGDEITVTAEDKDGFYFLGWEADAEVTFADAEALSTTFTMPASNVTVTANYAKILTVDEAIALIPNTNDTYNDAIVEAYITGNISYNSKYSSLTYDVQALDANGFPTGDVLQVYSGKGLNGADFSTTSDIAVGAKVLVFGQLKNYNGTPEFNSNNYLLSYDDGEYTGVVVYGEASKTAYEYNDDFDFTGLAAKDTWSNGYAQVVENPTWTATPAKVTEDGTIKVTASYTEDETEYISDEFDVAVTVILHAVTIAPTTNGTLVIKNAGEVIESGDKFVKGTELTVETTPAANYKLVSLTANGTDISETKSFTIDTEDVEVAATFEIATALDNTETGAKAVKVLRNGQLYIEKNGKTFNAQGQLVK